MDGWADGRMDGWMDGRMDDCLACVGTSGKYCNKPFFHFLVLCGLLTVETQIILHPAEIRW